MYLQLAAETLLRQCVAYYQQANNYHGDVHFHFHWKSGGDTTTSLGPFNHADRAEMENAVLKEKNEHLEAENARLQAENAKLEAAIPEAEIIAREYHAEI